MAAVRTLAAALLFVVVVFVVGSGLAAIDLPTGDDGCLEGRLSLLPYGAYDCMAFTDQDMADFRPSTAALLACLTAAAAIFALALRFRTSAAARGLASGAITLAVFGLHGHVLPPALALLSVPVYAGAVVFLVERRLDPSRGNVPPLAIALALPAPVVALGWIFELWEIGVPVGLAAGALIAATAERVSSTFRRAASP